MSILGFKKYSKPKTEVEVVSDLDALISKTVGFKFQDAIYGIKPLDMNEFLLVTNELAKLDALKTNKIKEVDQLLDGYQGLFDACLDKQIDVKTMRYTQVTAVFNLILECMMGKAQLEMEKKSPNLEATSNKTPS